MVFDEDKDVMLSKGITREQIEEQLQCLREGFPFLRILAAATVDRGILLPDQTVKEDYVRLWDDYSKSHKIVKFVPASGAASRMFKDLYAFLNESNQYPSTPFEMNFFNNITKFAFYSELNKTCKEMYGKPVVQLIVEGKYKDVVFCLLRPEGMNYGNLPKGLLIFHQNGNGVRTPVEEHLVEGAGYARSGDGVVYVHFTVSPEHRDLFASLVSQVQERYAVDFNANFNVNFSEQKPYTDTVAINSRGELFRTKDGKILFRPGGHGSLIENLNEIDADVVFIKNIDNVVPDSLKVLATAEKKMMGGLLVHVQKQVFKYLQMLERKAYTEQDLNEMKLFLTQKLCCSVPEGLTKDVDRFAAFLFRKFNRPIRVCAMVRNLGEPGGGPFLIYSDDGSVQLQILESSQINMNDARSRDIFENGTHFNPVDIVCSLKDFRGERFDLPKFVDKSTGFISNKSKDGRELKALEHPGLWNGSMSNWNTIFVEVPAETFNPVKTVNDLLRPQHLA